MELAKGSWSVYCEYTVSLKESFSQCVGWGAGFHQCRLLEQIHRSLGADRQALLSQPLEGGKLKLKTPADWVVGCSEPSLWLPPGILYSLPLHRENWCLPAASLRRWMIRDLLPWPSYLPTAAPPGAAPSQFEFWCPNFSVHRSAHFPFTPCVHQAHRSPLQWLCLLICSTSFINFCNEYPISLNRLAVIDDLRSVLLESVSYHLMIICVCVVWWVQV